MLWVCVLFALGFTPTTVAIEATVCDCTTPAHMGILQFSDENCRPEEDLASALPMTYAVYTEKRAEAKFPGQLCARWKIQKHVSVDFFGLTVVVTDKIALDTSLIECQIMYESHRCNDQQMKLVGNKYVFDEEPSESGYWLQTIITEKVNCVLERVPLYQQTEGSDFSTPIGTASATSGGLMHNHLTLIWDKTYTQTSEPKARELEAGEATLKYIGIPGKYRLTDDFNELIFHLTLNPRCIPSHLPCTRKTVAFDVIGQADVFIITTPVTPQNISLKEAHRHTLEADRLDVLANIQYMRDKLIDHENELAHAIASLQCDSRKATHERAISTAQYNGWLAASQLDLPLCAKLNAFGKTAVLITCTPQNVTFEVEMTSCGPQPRFGNYTINLDGWELVPFAPCYWTKGFVNFNDKPYGYRNNTWVPIEAKIVLPFQTLAHSFRYDDVKYFDYSHQSNPAYNDAIIDHMNIMADIAAAMNEHSAGNYLPSHVPSTSTILGTVADVAAKTTWMDQLTTLLYFTVVVIVAAVMIRVCIMCGFCGLIWRCCKPVRGPATNDLELGITGRNPTVPGVM